MQRNRRRRQIGAMALGFVAPLVSLALAAPAPGQDLSIALGSAEANAAKAEAQVDEAQAEVAAARQRYGAVSAQARPAQREVRAARNELSARRADIAARRRAAEGQIAQIEANHRGEVESHDDAVQGGAGLGLAALAAAGLVLGWSWFRASAAVAWLVGQQRVQVVGLCVGGGLVVLIGGAALSSTAGILGAIGVFVAALGPLLGCAFLLAHHSAQVQAARERPLLGRERLPAWATMSLAGITAVLCLSLLAGSVSSSAPRPARLNAAMKQTAAGVIPLKTKHALAAADAQARALERRSRQLTDRWHAARAVLSEMRGQLASARSRLAAAEGDIRRYSRQIEVAETREARQREKEERKAIAEAAREQACDPSYEGECLKDGIGDYDCAGGSGNGPNYVYSEVRVVGPDVFGLDANGNGIGCEGE